MRINGDVHLTIVSGGASAPVERPEGPDADALARSRRVAELCEGWEIPAWEGLAYVARLEALLGRPLSEEEADAMLARVCMIRSDAEDLRRMLAGSAVVVPTDALGLRHSLVETEGEGGTARWREWALETFESAVRERSA